LDHLEGYFIFRVAEIHERARVSALFWKQHFHQRVGIGRAGRALFAATRNGNKGRYYKNNGGAKPICHPERSAAESKDLLLLRGRAAAEKLEVLRLRSA